MDYGLYSITDLSYSIWFKNKDCSLIWIGRGNWFSNDHSVHLETTPHTFSDFQYSLPTVGTDYQGELTSILPLGRNCCYRFYLMAHIESS